MMAPSAKQSSGRKAYLNARLVDPAQGLDDKGGLLIEDGWILADGNKAVANARLFRRVLAYAKDFDMLVVQHAEEPSLATGVMNASETASRLGLAGTLAVSEVIMIERDLRLVESTGARYHVSQ